jgi:hypothetical protein
MPEVEGVNAVYADLRFVNGYPVVTPDATVAEPAPAGSMKLKLANTLLKGPLDGVHFLLGEGNQRQLISFVGVADANGFYPLKDPLAFDVTAQSNVLMLNRTIGSASTDLTPIVQAINANNQALVEMQAQLNKLISKGPKF